MTLHTLPAFIPNYSIIVWLMVNVFNVYGHLLCYSVTYCVDVRQSPVTSRQFGPSDSQNRYTTSLLSPHCVTVLCYTSLLLIVDPVEHYKPSTLCVVWRLPFSFHCVMSIKVVDHVDSYGFDNEYSFERISKFCGLTIYLGLPSLRVWPKFSGFRPFTSGLHV